MYKHADTDAQARSTRTKTYAEGTVSVASRTEGTAGACVDSKDSAFALSAARAVSCLTDGARVEDTARRLDEQGAKSSDESSQRA